MDNFITLNYLGSFAGMIFVVVLFTQFTKDLVDKVAKWLPTRYVTFIYSLIVIFGYQSMSGTFDKSKILLTVINAILLTMTAQGGYEWIYKPVEVKAANSALTPPNSAEIKTITASQIYTKPVAEKPVNNSTENTAEDLVADPTQIKQ